MTIGTVHEGGAWPKLKWALIGYVALVIVGTWLLVRGNVEATLPVTVGWLWLPVPLAIAGISLATGWAPVRFGTYAAREGEMSVVFWIVVIFQALLAVGLVLFALGVFERLLHPQ